MSKLEKNKQKAVIAVDALPFFEAEAKKRQLATLKKGDNFPDREILPEREGKATEQVGKVFGVSGLALQKSYAGSSPR